MEMPKPEHRPKMSCTERLMKIDNLLSQCGIEVEPIQINPGPSPEAIKLAGSILLPPALKAS
jgi:hypothetical protein